LLGSALRRGDGPEPTGRARRWDGPSRVHRASCPTPGPPPPSCEPRRRCGGVNDDARSLLPPCRPRALLLGRRP
jgi:hypothetical protein